MAPGILHRKIAIRRMMLTEGLLMFLYILVSLRNNRLLSIFSLRAVEWHLDMLFMLHL